jgi:phospholipid/cholesterol/gamma-HCH transport system substrate-binding protein
MKRFSERNPIVIGAVASAVTAGLVLFGLTFDQIPFLATGNSYSAYFADAGAIQEGTEVQVSGSRVGKVSNVTLDGPKARVEFTIDSNIRIGDRTEAAIKTQTLLGTKVVEVTPRGDGHLSRTIPLERTTSPYQLPDALGDLTKTISGLDTPQLSESLDTLAQTFKDTPPDLRVAVDGVTRLSRTLNTRDEQLRNLLANANKATGVLRQRTDQIVGLIANANALLAQLQMQSGSLDQIANNISAVSKQLSGLIAENRDQFRPALDKLNGVLSIVDNRKERVQKSIKLLNAYAMSLGESVSSGPFFNAYVANLLPGQFVQPFVDVAFSDLGLDPSVLLPSERTDPQVGQPAMPALPVPYPRTGQGGDPRMTLPDAITGKPGDPRYPYREPPPAPAPGGPPPGPPPLPEIASVPAPTPAPVYQPAPGEVTPAPVGAGPPPGPVAPTASEGGQ